MKSQKQRLKRKHKSKVMHKESAQKAAATRAKNRAFIRDLKEFRKQRLQEELKKKNEVVTVPESDKIEI